MADNNYCRDRFVSNGCNRFFSLSVVMKRYASYIVVVNGTTTKVQLNVTWELVTNVAEIHAPKIHP
jgi:hypothetical protein